MLHCNGIDPFVMLMGNLIGDPLHVTTLFRPGPLLVTNATMSVLPLRRGNRDNLELIFHITL